MTIRQQSHSGACPRETDYRMRILCGPLAAVLYLQAVAPHGWAQSPPAAIQLVVVQGEAAINNVGQRSSSDPVVRVDDEADKPVPGASVVFSLPTDGPSGVFGNGEKTLIVVTDARGEATAAGLRVNTLPGRLQIHVNASFRGRTARANITQFNMTTPGKRAGGGSGGKVALILLAIAGAAGGGAAVALRNKNGTPAAPPSPAPAPVPIGIAPGTGTVGPPR